MSHPFKFTEPTDKMPGGWHGAYLGVYAKLFEPLKDTTGAILEIGVDGGGSLLMYADYFKNASKVIGMDISPCPKAITNRGGITFIQGNAYSDAGKLIGNPDFALMVDDGPHQIGSQRFFCAHYPNLLLPEGIAIVEDVQRVEDFALLADATPKEFFTYGIDLRWHDNRYDNLLFVIQRK